MFGGSLPQARPAHKGGADLVFLSALTYKSVSFYSGLAGLPLPTSPRHQHRWWDPVTWYYSWIGEDMGGPICETPIAHGDTCPGVPQWRKKQRAYLCGFHYNEAVKGELPMATQSKTR